MEVFYFAAVFLSWHTVVADDSFETGLEYLAHHPPRYVCSDIEIHDSEGIVISPNYPSSYPSHLSSSCRIVGNVGEVITVTLDDVDIEGNCNNLTRICCLYNWLKIGNLANESEKVFCGRNIQYHYPIVSGSHKLWVKFHTSNFVEGGRGFRFHYKIAPRSESICKENEFKCSNYQCVPKVLRCNGYFDCEDGSDEQHCSSHFPESLCKVHELSCQNKQCIPSSKRCNGIPDCEDASDEQDCSNRCASGRSCRSVFQCYEASKHCDGISHCPDSSDEMDCGFCPQNLVRCGRNSTQCYNPLIHKCDRIFHCINGEDEKDCFDLCPGKIMCNSGRGCYPVKHRCNGVAQCEDASDEKNCVPELCNYEHGGFLCDNDRCIQEVWTCDHTDDCGDGSDEKNCLRNSVLTAAIMGSLICALLLVIAIRCTCRLHALRVLQNRLASRETPLSRLSREFFFREPPPSYAVAVQGSQHHNLYVENFHYGVPVPNANYLCHTNTRRSHRRNRQSRHSRNSIVGPQLPSETRSRALRNAEVLPVQPVCDSNTSEERPNIESNLQVSPEVAPVKDDSLTPVTVLSPNVTKEPNNDKNSIQSATIVPALGSAPDSTELEGLEVSSAGESIHAADHFYCDSDSEPLVA